MGYLICRAGDQATIGSNSPEPDAAVFSLKLQDQRSFVVPSAQGRTQETTGGVCHDENISVYGRNDRLSALPSASGQIPEDDWNHPGEKIVGKLTQWPARHGAVHDNGHCAASALLAAHLMRGPEDTAHFLEDTADNARGFASDDHVKKLKEIALKIRRRDASFEDLSTAQFLVYGAANKSISGIGWRLCALPVGGTPATDAFQKLMNKLRENLTPGDLDKIATIASTVYFHRGVTATKNEFDISFNFTGDRDSIDTDECTSGLHSEDLQNAALAGGDNPQLIRDYLPNEPEKPMNFGSLNRVLDKLQPGESALVTIASAVESPPGESALATLGVPHEILVGRLDDGSPFIYDPDPVAGRATLTIGSADKARQAEFNNELKKWNEPGRFGSFGYAEEHGKPVIKI